MPPCRKRFRKMKKTRHSRPASNRLSQWMTLETAAAAAAAVKVRRMSQTRSCRLRTLMMSLTTLVVSGVLVLLP